jgi:3D (Asp-Asp-Asp) domain-containing protein
MKIIMMIILLMAICFVANADTFKITSYCSCVKCCGKSDGIMASGKKVYNGACAMNWLPFGTKVRIEGLGIYTVEDRGAKSLFGSKTNRIKHIDIWMPSHKDALKFGVKYKEVEIL